MPTNKTNPHHYDRFPKGCQPIDFIRAAGWLEDFCKGNIVRYLSRAGNKASESALDDYRKARWYLGRLIALEESRNPPQVADAPTDSEAGYPTLRKP